MSAEDLRELREALDEAKTPQDEVLLLEALPAGRLGPDELTTAALLGHEAAQLLTAKLGKQDATGAVARCSPVQCLALGLEVARAALSSLSLADEGHEEILSGVARWAWAEGGSVDALVIATAELEDQLHDRLDAEPEADLAAEEGRFELCNMLVNVAAAVEALARAESEPEVTYTVEDRRGILEDDLGLLLQRARQVMGSGHYARTLATAAARAVLAANLL